MDYDSSTSSPSRPGPIADDAASIAERLKQIQREEGRAERKPEAQEDHTYWGRTHAEWDGVCALREGAYIAGSVTIESMVYELWVGPEGTYLTPYIPAIVPDLF